MEFAEEFAVSRLPLFATRLLPGVVRVVAAESLSLKRQTMIGNRSGQRAPNLTARAAPLERIIINRPRTIGEHCSLFPA
jgi:hypothetical protein